VPEFVSKTLDRWAYANDLTLVFSQSGKPTDNAFLESYDGRRQNVCRNAHWFLSLAEAKAKLEAWPRQYNESPSANWAGVVNAPRICLGCSPDRGRMKPGSSPSGAQNRGTVRPTRTLVPTGRKTRSRDLEDLGRVLPTTHMPFILAKLK
jgi:hypothetical protein